MSEAFLHGVEVVTVDGGARPISTAATSVIGLVGTAPKADPVAFPLNTPVLVANSRTLAAKLSSVTDPSATGEDTLSPAIDSILDQAGAMIVVVRVEAGVDTAASIANVVGGVNALDGKHEGVHALLAAESVVGVKPRILIAPGFTHQRANGEANAVVAELVGIAERLRAVVIADGPGTTDAAAIAAAGDNGSDRVYLVDPRVRKINAAGQIVDAFASACVAGVIARSDNDRGFWHSPSNQLINGIVGTSRAIDFALGDRSSSANILNEAKVATIVRQNGFRLWGNRSLAADPKWAFLAVRRTADIIADSLQAAHLWAVDRGITKSYLSDVTEGVNAYLRDLTTKGAILGGQCWADPELNSAQNIAQGRVYWNFDFTPTYPAEHLTFRSHLVDNYIQELF